MFLKTAPLKCLQEISLSRITGKAFALVSDSNNNERRLLSLPSPLLSPVGSIRCYNNPYHKINWVKHRFWARVWWYSHKNCTLPQHRENHEMVQSRFKVTRWGIQRLRAKRNNFWVRMNANHSRMRKLQSIAYVARDDIRRVQKQLGGIRFRMSTTYRDNNVNVKPLLRQSLPAHFG